MKYVRKQKWILGVTTAAILVTTSAWAEDSAAPTSPVARKSHKKKKKHLKEAAPVMSVIKAAPGKSLSRPVARKGSDSIKTSASASSVAPTITRAPVVSSTPTQSSSASASVPASSAPSRYSLNFNTTWWGPSFASPGSLYQPNTQGDNSDPKNIVIAGSSNKQAPVYSENVLTLGYKLNDKWSIAPSFFWDMTLAGGKEGTGVGMAGGSSPLFDLNDSFVTLSNSSFFKRGNYNLSGYFRYFAPISQNSQSKNSLGTFRFLVNNSYDIPKSNWNLGFAGYAQWYARHSAPNGSWATRFYSGSSVNYKASSVFTLGVLYEAEFRTQYGIQADAGQTGGPDTFVAEATDLEPNFSWDISKKANFGMWINVPTGHDERRALDTISFGATFTWTFL